MSRSIRFTWFCALRSSLRRVVWAPSRPEAHGIPFQSSPSPSHCSHEEPHPSVDGHELQYEHRVDSSVRVSRESQPAPSDGTSGGRSTETDTEWAAGSRRRRCEAGPPIRCSTSSDDSDATYSGPVRIGIGSGAAAADGGGSHPTEDRDLGRRNRTMDRRDPPLSARGRSGGSTADSASRIGETGP